MKYFQNMLTNSSSRRCSFKNLVLTWILRKIIQYICRSKKKLWSKLENYLLGKSAILLFSLSVLCNYKTDRFTQLLPKTILRWASVCFQLYTFLQCQPCKLCILWHLYINLYHISVSTKKSCGYWVLSYDKNTALVVLVCKNIISKSWNQKIIPE